jgi:alpha-galactosidase
VGFLRLDVPGYLVNIFFETRQMHILTCKPETVFAFSKVNDRKRLFIGVSVVKWCYFCVKVLLAVKFWGRLPQQCCIYHWVKESFEVLLFGSCILRLLWNLLSANNRGVSEH